MYTLNCYINWLKNVLKIISQQFGVYSVCFVYDELASIELSQMAWILSNLYYLLQSENSGSSKKLLKFLPFIFLLLS